MAFEHNVMYLNKWALQILQNPIYGHRLKNLVKPFIELDKNLSTNEISRILGRVETILNRQRPLAGIDMIGGYGGKPPRQVYKRKTISAILGLYCWVNTVGEFHPIPEYYKLKNFRKN